MSRQHIIEELLNSESFKKATKTIIKKQELPVYQLQFPIVEEITKEAFQWANNIFNESNSDDKRPYPHEYEDRLVLLHPHGSRIRTYYLSGYLEYSNMKRIFSGKTDKSIVNEIEKIVRDYGSKHNLWPLDSEGQIEFEGTQFVNSQHCNLQGMRSEVVINNIIAVFNRVTNGIPWIGPGSKITAIVEGKDVVAFQRHWRKLISKQVNIQILSIEKVLKKMIDNISYRLDGRSIEAEDLDFRHIEFGYYAAGRHTLQRYLQPAYTFVYKVNSKYGNASFSDTYLAHNENFENIMDPEKHPKLIDKER